MDFDSHPWLKLIQLNDQQLLKRGFPQHAFMKFNNLDSLQIAILYAPQSVAILYPLFLYQTQITYDPLQFAYIHKKYDLYHIFYASFKKLKDNKTVLMQAVLDKDNQSVMVLLQYEIYVVNQSQETALILALKYRNLDIIQFLQIEQGLGAWTPELDYQFKLILQSSRHQTQPYQIQLQPQRQTTDIIANYQQFQLSKNPSQVSYINQEYTHPPQNKTINTSPIQQSQQDNQKVKHVQINISKSQVKDLIYEKKETEQSDSIESIDELSIVDQLHKENRALRKENSKLKKRIYQLENESKRQVDISEIANKEPEIPICLSKSGMNSSKKLQ
ncbi:hypothetical protein SS50377_27520 [Spironucleus salmonicida]|uniref:Ankyrin repeat-containing protein n=1 Tax=Spironucleus salmonicida TaxID=348837 RepID=V6LQE1_9EUKA|nr:hypothetical protein SS50377_27520 [Spironucleus salmonicida]|eukprot:EST46887.1 Hypothetical protein SS50377_13040 [Spironucleus salmonicida]